MPGTYTTPKLFNKHDIIKFHLIFGLAIFFVYFTPNIISLAFFIVLIFMFFFSRDDYFWLAVFFIFINQPGSLFQPTKDGQLGFPEIRIFANFSVSVIELFVLAALIKAIKTRKKKRVFLAKQQMVIFAYAILLMILSVLVWETSFTRIFKDIRYFLFSFLILPFTILIQNPKDHKRFLSIILSSIGLITFFQLFFIFSGGYFVTILNPALIIKSQSITTSGQIASRYFVIHEHFLYLVIMTISMYLLAKKHYSYNENRRLGVIILLSIFGITITATRVWFISFMFIFIFIQILNQKNFLKFASYFALFFVIYVVSPTIKNQIDNSLDRVLEVFIPDRSVKVLKDRQELLSKNDLPQILNGINQSPIVGWGFSDYYYKNTSNDVGNFNLIFQVGILGFLLFFYFWIYNILLFLKIRQRSDISHREKNSLFVLLIVFISLFIPHFTTTQIYRFPMSYGAATFFSVFLYISGYALQDTLKNRKKAVIENTTADS